jgi:lipopolysaccharide export system permease protein
MGFVLLLLLVEITDKIKYYFQYGPATWLMVKYFLVKLPGYLTYAIPLSILIGGMLSLLMMGRHSELVAMQANGVDALAIARPVLLSGLAASAMMFVAGETVIPWSNRYSEYIQDVEIVGQADRTFVKNEEIWMRSLNSITHVRKFSKKDKTMDRVTVVLWDDDYNFTQRLCADKAKWWDNGWIFFGVNRTRRMPDGKMAVDVVPSMPGPLDRKPEDFGVVERVAKEMNLGQLSDYIEKITEEGQQPTRYLVDWHNKIAFPLVCLVMSGLSVPFAIKAGPRAGGVGIGIAISTVVAFGYWVVHTIFIGLGHIGVIPPIAAAWAANVLFGLIAGILLLGSGT